LAEIQDEEAAAYSARAALSLHNYYFFRACMPLSYRRGLTGALRLLHGHLQGAVGAAGYLRGLRLDPAR